MRPAWPRYAATPVFSSTYAVARNLPSCFTVSPKSNVGDLTALRPSASLRNATWSRSCFAITLARSRVRPDSAPPASAWA